MKSLLNNQSRFCQNLLEILRGNQLTEHSIEIGAQINSASFYPPILNICFCCSRFTHKRTRINRISYVRDEVSHEANGTQQTHMSKSYRYNQHHTLLVSVHLLVCWSPSLFSSGQCAINALKCHVFHAIGMLGVTCHRGLMGDYCTLGRRRDE